MASPYFTISPIQYVQCQNEIRMPLYLHQVVSGAGQNQLESVVPSQRPASGFGGIAVNDWTVIDAPDPRNAKIVAGAKVMHVQADQANAGWFAIVTVVFEDERFKGSSLQMMGITAATGEWAIVGGSGEFTMAHGTTKYKALLSTPNVESIRELDIHAYYMPNTQTVQVALTISNATVDKE